MTTLAQRVFGAPEPPPPRLQPLEEALIYARLRDVRRDAVSRWTRAMIFEEINAKKSRRR